MSETKNEVSESLCQSNEPSEIIPGYSSVEQFTKDGFKTLMEAIRHSNALPTGRDWNFYNTSDSFTKIINEEGSNVLRLMNQIMRCNEIESNIKNKVLDEKTELVVEANDAILEKVANNIDEMNGIRKCVPEPVIIQTVSTELPINGSWNRTSAATITVNSSSPTLGKNCIKLITAKNIVRPQKFFKDKIDNSNKYPWCPRITDKPNSLKPLAIFLEESENGEEYSHPYEFELYRFTPTPEQLLEEVPQFPPEVSKTPLVEINQPEQLDDLIETLRLCKEFAVDLEHHSYRSFMGFTCLLQISTKDKDYLIDTLTLRDKLCILNEVFTNNKIVKIFHGADKDIEWLQRDLSIYVVNMFDTHQAAKVLQYPALSLAFLMKKFCNILPNKQFQLADWRIRPLPDEFKTYAREDTHYLIYIYKMLKKELLMKGNESVNLLKSVIERSTELCKKRYLKPILRDDSHLDMYRKCKKMFDNRQLYALKELYTWRDNLAREEDESLAYVLPNHMLLQISETLPREMQGILACCNPIPPLVRSHLLELHQIVLKAREQPLEKAILKEVTAGRGVLKKVSKVNIDSPLHCPHDLSKTNDFRDDLPTLLNFDELKLENRKFADLKLSTEKSCSYSIYDNSEDSDEGFDERETFKKLRGVAYFSPYERYKLVKPFIAEEEKAAQAVKEEEEVKEPEPVEDVKDDRSNEERIASIRDHFLQLSKKFSEELEAKKLQEETNRVQVEVEDSRKRKRGYDEEEAKENGVGAPSTVVNWRAPNKFGNNKKNKGQKRKFSEIGSSSDYGEVHSNQTNQQFYKKRKNNQQWQKQNNVNQFNQQQPQQKKETRKQRKERQRNSNPNYKPRQLTEEQKLERERQKIVNQQKQKLQPKRQYQRQNQLRKLQQKQQLQNNENQFIQQQQQQNQNRHLRFSTNEQHSRNQEMNFQQNNGPMKNQPKNKKQNKNRKRQDNTNFVPYDYSSVDFRQFQGGAGSAIDATNIKSKFNANKNRRKMGNKGTKSGVFNMNKNRGKGKNSAN